MTQLYAISTQGGGTVAPTSWVSKFEIAFSQIERGSWELYRELDRKTILEGNNDAVSVANNTFAKMIQCSAIRIYPREWQTSIALRTEVYRHIVCGDGFWDTFEGCDDKNIMSDDGCSGYDAGAKGVSGGPCEPETLTTQSNPSGYRRAVSGVSSGQELLQTTSWCNPARECMDCTQLPTTYPRTSFEPSTMEFINDPNYLKYCQGQEPATSLDPADFSTTKADMGHDYRVHDPRAQTDHDGFHGQGLHLYTQLPFEN
eukprot:g5270.t1